MKLALISSLISSSTLKEFLSEEYKYIEIEQFNDIPENIEKWAEKPEYFCAIIDINLCKKEHFKLLSILKEIPIIVSIDTLENQNSRIELEEAIIRGAQGYLEKELNREQLTDYLYPQYDRLKHCDSYSNTIIDSFVAFHSTQDIAAKMISIAKIVCRGYGIPNAERSDIYRALKILAVAIKTNSIIKTIKFFEDIRIARAILDILKASIKPNDLKSNLIHMIYNFQRVLHHNRELSEYVTKSGDEDIYAEVRRIFERKEIFLEKNLNLESIWIDIIDATNECQEEDANIIDDFIRYANSISKYSIIYCRGSIVKILKSDDKIEYLLNLQKKHHLFDEIFKKINSEIATENITLTQDGKNVTLTLQRCNQAGHDTSEVSLAKSVEATIEEEHRESNVSLHFSDGAKRTKIAAVDYVEEIRLEVDIDEYLDTLMHLESDIEETITSETRLSREALAKASDIFSRYGAFLGELPQFSELSYVVFTLSSVLRNTDFHSIEQNEKIIYKMLVAVLDDLKNWKITNFITQDSQDIHYLDDSMLSSCSQLESLLNQKDTHEAPADEDDDNDLELF